MKFSSYEIMKDENLKRLNEILVEYNIFIEKDYDDMYDVYAIKQNNKVIFDTIHPKEIIIKIAQLLPESEVRIGRYEVFDPKTNEDLSLETLDIEI